MKKTLYTFTALAKEYGKDLSYVAKMVRKFKLKVTPTMDGKNPCQALTEEEKFKLEKRNKLLTVPRVVKGEKTVAELAKERGQDVSGLLKFLKAHGFTLMKRLRQGSRPVNVISEKEYLRLNKKFPIRVRI